MIVPVDQNNVLQAATVHSVSWIASHRSFCAPDFVSVHTPERQQRYLLDKMQKGSSFFLLAEPLPVGVVSTLEILFGQNVAAAISPLSAVCLLVFSLLYTPCVAAVASIRRELGRGWAVGVVVWQCVIAWVAASVAHLIGMIAGGV